MTIVLKHAVTFLSENETESATFHRALLALRACGGCWHDTVVFMFSTTAIQYLPKMATFMGKKSNRPQPVAIDRFEQGSIKNIDVDNRLFLIQ